MQGKRDEEEGERRCVQEQAEVLGTVKAQLATTKAQLALARATVCDQVCHTLSLPLPLHVHVAMLSRAGLVTERGV